jgi:hypothetical protein
MNTAFYDINDWFKAKQLSMHFYETHYFQFTAINNNPLTEIKAACDKEQTTLLSNIKFIVSKIKHLLHNKNYQTICISRANKSGIQSEPSSCY